MANCVAFFSQEMASHARNWDFFNEDSKKAEIFDTMMEPVSRWEWRGHPQQVCNQQKRLGKSLEGFPSWGPQHQPPTWQVQNRIQEMLIL